ncbi:MAG: nicotinamide-nucleotide adenylyltransferase [Candidatus Aenigmarchaeota archaeon]|nr:nicotinamide-nucleotide adenylyltransferase [Candidatus Aenigmarchaeota archaeon]
MAVAFFIGRFQPFHKGHLKDIQRALDECEKVIIAIGSSQEQGTINNPFSYKQRKKMIQLTLGDEHIEKNKYEIIAIPDINNNDLWVRHVESLCPKFDVIYTGNALVKKLFLLKKYKVVDIELFQNINSTKIREKILDEKEWKNLVPNTVSKYLEDIDGEDIIKNII